MGCEPAGYLAALRLGRVRCERASEVSFLLELLAAKRATNRRIAWRSPGAKRAGDLTVAVSSHSAAI